jgi:hypothetical protein
MMRPDWAPLIRPAFRQKASAPDDAMRQQLPPAMPDHLVLEPRLSD